VARPGAGGTGVAAVRAGLAASGSVVAPPTVAGTGTVTLALRSSGQGVVFAGRPEPTVAVVIREGPGDVVFGPETDTVQVEDEPMTVTVG
ncbi:MAG: hypothetical protein OEY97_13515, partial [Nitrospirota bacterium]|nr:hypothetical protein [Nitrospirota bacterium]